VNLHVFYQWINNGTTGGQTFGHSCHLPEPPMGPSRRIGHSFLKASASCLVYLADSGSPTRWVSEYLPQRRMYTRTCSSDAFPIQQKELHKNLEISYFKDKNRLASFLGFETICILLMFYFACKFIDSFIFLTSSFM
jgi:hypothetical protein